MKNEFVYCKKGQVVVVPYGKNNAKCCFEASMLFP